jgi:hypothetical protein
MTSDIIASELCSLSKFGSSIEDGKTRSEILENDVTTVFPSIKKPNPSIVNLSLKKEPFSAKITQVDILKQSFSALL